MSLLTRLQARQMRIVQIVDKEDVTWWRLHAVHSDDLRREGMEILLAVTPKKKGAEPPSPTTVDLERAHRRRLGMLAAGVVATSTDGVEWTPTRVLLDGAAAPDGVLGIPVDLIPTSWRGVLLEAIDDMTHGGAGANPSTSFPGP